MNLWTQAFASLAGLGIGALIALWIDAGARARQSRRHLAEAEARAQHAWDRVLESLRSPQPRRHRLVARNEAGYRRLRAARHRAWYL